jgi:hypothetical protein
MNGVDYTKQLAKDREYFQDATRKTKAAADRRVADTNERAEHVMQKQRENFVEDRAELEKHYQKNLNELKDKSQASLENNSAKFNEQMEKERQDFTMESLKKSKEFNQRLSDIKSSYSKAFSGEEDRNRDLETTMKAKYDRNVNNLKTGSEAQFSKYQDKMATENRKLRDDYNDEKQTLMRTQDDRLAESYRDAAEKRADLRNKVISEMKKSKASHEADLSHLREHGQDRYENLQKDYQSKFETMAKDFGNRTENMARVQKQNDLKTTIENRDKLNELRTDFNEDLRLMNMEKRKSNGSGDFEKVAKRQQGLKDQVVYEDKIKKVKNDLVDAQRSYQHRADSDHKAHMETLKKESFEATMNLEKKLGEANAEKILTVTKEREKAEAQVQNREHQNRLDKMAYEQQVMLEKNNAEERLKKLKENFSTSMKTLEEKHQASLQDVTKTSNQDKNAFMKKMQENRSQEIFEMKREFARMMDATVQDYEQRIATYQRDNDYLKLSMSEKIANIISQTEKQLESQQKLFEDRRAADQKGQQLLMDQRENQLKKDFKDMNLAYQKKIDKMQVENDSKLKLITNDYESKLKELKATTSKQLAEKDTNHQIELERVKQAYEAEKTRLVSSYESQLQAAKATHKEQMEQMKNYKQLS